MALAAVEGYLLIFHQNKLAKNVKLPFNDCTDILVHRSYHSNIYKEFAIAFSSYAKHACVVDIQLNAVSFIFVQLFSLLKIEFIFFSNIFKDCKRMD